MKTIFLLLLLGIAGCASDQQRQIADSHLSFSEFITAVRASNSNMAPSVWLHIANDSTFSPDQRRVAIFQLFHHYVSPGMSVGRLADLLNCPTWLRDNQIEEVMNIAGGIPVRSGLGDTIITMAVCMDTGASSVPQIYLRLGGRIDRATFSSIIRGQLKHGPALEIPILEVASLEYHTNGYPVENAWGLNLDVRGCGWRDR